MDLDISSNTLLLLNNVDTQDTQLDGREHSGVGEITSEI